MSITTSRSLESNALAYLIARPGEKFKASDLGDFFGCDAKTIRHKLIDLNLRGKIRAKTEGRTVMYWAEPLTAVAEPRQSPITHKTYALPAVLAERGREIQSDRAAFPSRHI